MTKEECFKCKNYNEANERNSHNIGYFIKEWCDISKAHNKYLMTDKKCPYYEFG